MLEVVITRGQFAGPGGRRGWMGHLRRPGEQATLCGRTLTTHSRAPSQPDATCTMCAQAQERRAELQHAERERDEARVRVEELEAGRLGLGRLQLLRVFIEESAKDDPGGIIGDFCASVLKQVDSAGSSRENGGTP